MRKQKIVTHHWFSHLIPWSVGIAASVMLAMILDYIVAPLIIQNPNINPYIVDTVISLCKQINANCGSPENLLPVFRVPLKSSVGIDYINLRYILVAKNWKEADQETYKLMLKALGQLKEESISASDIKHYPCDDLVTIDQLWQKSSDGKFGFRKQYEIWQDVRGMQTANVETVDAFGERVGWLSSEDKKLWKSYDQLNFSTNAEDGHLPAMFYYVNCLGWGCMKGDIPDEKSSVFFLPQRFLYCSKP